MNESEITVKNLFAMTEGKLPAGARSVFEASHQIPSLKENLRSQVKWLPWTLVRDDIERKIAHLLDVPLVELLTAVWKKYEILVKYADRDKDRKSVV